MSHGGQPVFVFGLLLLENTQILKHPTGEEGFVKVQESVHVQASQNDPLAETLLLQPRLVAVENGWLKNPLLFERKGSER